MQIRHALAIIAITVTMVGCSGGDIKLQPTNVDNSVDNSTSGGGGGALNPCANYTDGAGDFFQGTFDGANCTYGSDFVGASNPLMVDLTIPFISGVHIFQDSLVVGEDVSSGAAPQCGDTLNDPCDGPTLTVAAGNTLAFLDANTYVLINRGSRIIANGTSNAPIIFTGYSDAVLGAAGPEDVQLWGGLVISGNGVTNNCTDAQRAADQCHVVGEGTAHHYGGSNNAESSGSLKYVMVKYPGFEVSPDNELNGFTITTVGSGTVLSHIEAYSTYDDGIEFFGGAVNVDHYIGLYVKDDSIDFSDGYSGTFDRALVIQSLTDGNRCIEGDNVGASRIANGEDPNLAPISHPTINRMTCIIASGDNNTHGDSEGPLLRVGARAAITNSIVYGGEPNANDPSNECFEIGDGDTQSPQAAQDGDTTMQASLIVCTEATKGTLPNGDPLAEWVTDTSGSGADYSFNTFDAGVDVTGGGGANTIVKNVVITDMTNANVNVVIPGTYYSVDLDLDANGVPQTYMTDDTGADIPIVPTTGEDGIGAVIQSDDWTSPWAYGLRAGNQGEPLWFE